MSVFQTGMTMPANGARNIDQRFYPEVGAGGFKPARRDLAVLPAGQCAGAAPR